ncbi:MAG: type I restriction enzyme HsdR N-terminal domain-containing protein [Haliscomenobacter sp.]
MMDLSLHRFKDALQVRTAAGKRQVWDVIRKKWVALTPEETVRQLLIHYLLQEKGYNKNRLNLEKQLKVADRIKRFDILAWSPDMQPFLMVECKAPNISIDSAVFFQIANYHLAMQVPFLVLTNGIATYCCYIDSVNAKIEVLDAIPTYPEAGFPV